MAEHSLSYNLERLANIKGTILNSIRSRGDVTVPNNAKLSDVPTLIDNMSLQRVTIQSVEEGLTKGGSVGLRMAICSDIHIEGDPTREHDIRAVTLFTRLGQQYAAGELDVVVCCGDLIGPEAPSYEDFVAIKQYVDNWKTLLQGCPIFFVPGNHDTASKQNDQTAWSLVVGQTTANLTGTSNGITKTACSEKVFRIDIKGETLLFYGGYGKRWSAKDNINTAAERQWIMNQLDSCADMGRVFMFTHFYYPLNDFGFRDTSGTYEDNSGDRHDSLRIYETIAMTYKNLIWVSGHSHTAWGKELSHPTIKAHSNNSARLVACPSLGQADNNQYAFFRCYNDMAYLEGLTNVDGSVVSNAHYFFPKAADSQMTYYNVSMNLTGVDSSWAGSRVVEDGSLETTLSLQQYYSNPVVTVTMGGVDITSTAYNSGTGRITIAQVTGNVVITAYATMSGFYTVSRALTGYTYSGLVNVAENDSLSGSLALSSGWLAGTVTITMGGTDITSQAYNSSTGEIYIGTVTGNVVITATATAIYSVTTNVDNGITVNLGQVTDHIAANQALNGTVSDPTALVTIMMGGVNITSSAYTAATGAIYIGSVTGDVVITVRSNTIDWSNWVQMELNITDISAPTQLFESLSYVSDVYIDEVAVTAATTYQFASTGIHKVYFKATDNQIHTGLLHDTTTLYRIKTPVTLTAISAGSSNAAFKTATLVKAELLGVLQLKTYVFQSCSGLTELNLGNVTNIKDNSIKSSPNISVLRFTATTAPTVEAGAFDSFSANNGTVYYPSGSDYSSIQTMLSGWTFVGE